MGSDSGGGGPDWEWQKGLEWCREGGGEEGVTGGARGPQEGCLDQGRSGGAGGWWDSGIGPSLGDTTWLWKEWKVLQVSEVRWSSRTQGLQHLINVTVQILRASVIIWRRRDGL